MTHEANVFMDGAPILSGTWYNTKTGDSFTVRDTYFEDNNLFVLATDGRRFDYNMLQNYVQSDKPLAPQPQQPVQPINKQLPKEVTAIIEQPTDGILPEDLALINGSANNTLTTVLPSAKPTQQKTVAVSTTSTYEDEDTMLIRRLLARGSKPTINISIKWDKFPYKQMDMLDMMGVEFDKIVDYYIKTAVDIDVLKENISTKIDDYLTKTLSTTGEPPVGTASDDASEAIEKPKKEVKKAVTTKIIKKTTKK